ncbi:ubiquitin-related domain-containing protein [Choanephora cucurbitarum]|nr:ubiquitin-related domain-containing protein [Choanephora cucurbitarum]
MSTSNEQETTFDRQIKVLRPPTSAGPTAELPESAYKLSPNEIKQLYQSTVERRERLENSPLKTQKMRDKEEFEKLKKYPKTTIRIRMPNHTVVQAVFESKETVGALYDFVRSCLETPERKFVLCLPPRTKLTEPSITLFKAGLSPASNVLFGWIEKANEGHGFSCFSSIFPTNRTNTIFNLNIFKY